ETFYVDG
nr:Chain P, RT/RH substrate peptide [Human immunodeficiency virus 1]